MPSSFVPTVTAITTSQDLQWLVQPTLISSMAQSQGQPLGSQPPAVDPYDMPGTSYSTPGISGYSSGGAGGSGGPSTSGTTSGPGPARPSRARPRRPREETVSKRHQNFIRGEGTKRQELPHVGVGGPLAHIGVRGRSGLSAAGTLSSLPPLARTRESLAGFWGFWEKRRCRGR